MLVQELTGFGCYFLNKQIALAGFKTGNIVEVVCDMSKAFLAAVGETFDDAAAAAVGNGEMGGGERFYRH